MTWLKFGILLLTFVWVSNSALLCNIQVDTDAGVSLKFNLAPYVLTEYSLYDEGYYCVKDAEADVYSWKNTSYCFNLCSPVLEYPINEDWDVNTSYCSPDMLPNDVGYCPEGESQYQCDNNASARVSYTGKSWAYQIRNNARTSNSDPNERDCWPLSDEYGGKPPQSYLYDEDDPTSGIVISYTNGEYAAGCGSNRQFNLVFKCNNQRYRIPKTEVVTESPSCTYTIELESIYGCPTQCSQTNSICSGNGLCGYDWGINEAKCFCFQEFGGESCDEISSIIFTPSQKQQPPLSSSVVIKKTPTYYGTDNKGDEIQADIDVIFDYRVFDLGDGAHYLVERRNPYGYPWGNFDFYISIGREINKIYIPEECDFVTGPCFDYDEETGLCLHETSDMYNGTGYVYQFDVDSRDCYLLGREPVWELLNSVDDFAQGLRVSYLGGTYSVGCQTPLKNRQFDINFLCPNAIASYNWNTTYDFNTHEINFTTEVTEDNNCEYEITIENALACPYQCITSDPNDPNNLDKFSVCSGRGKCAADPYAGFVRCICDTGFSGDECEIDLTSQPPTKEPTPEPTEPCDNDGSAFGDADNDKKCTALIVIVIILAVVLIVGGALGYYKYNKDVKQVRDKGHIINERNTLTTGGGDAETGNGHDRVNSLDDDDDDAL